MPVFLKDQYLVQSLFSLYINDIVDEIGSCIRLFADDTSIYMIVEDPGSVVDLVNADLLKIHSWANQWLVKYNPNKIEELIITKNINFQITPFLWIMCKLLELNNISIFV